MNPDKDRYSPEHEEPIMWEICEISVRIKDEHIEWHEFEKKFKGYEEFDENWQDIMRDELKDYLKHFCVNDLDDKLISFSENKWTDVRYAIHSCGFIMMRHKRSEDIEDDGFYEEA